MVHEQLEFDKASPPAFTDRSGALKFQQSIKEKLDGIWTMMFPWASQRSEEDRARMEAFRVRREREKREGPQGPWWRPWKEE